MAIQGSVVVEIDRSRYATRVSAGRHSLTADEPGELGGSDSGPGPYDLLLSAIGSCTVISARMYADRKDWPLERVRAELWHERRSPGDETIHMRLSFEGALSDEQRARLGVIAGKCPVKRTVTGELSVDVEMA